MIDSDALAFAVSLKTLKILIPELLLLFAATSMMTAGAFLRLPRRVWVQCSLGALFIALVALYGVRTTAPDVYAAVAINDAFSGFTRLGLLLAGFVIIALAHDQVDDARAPEYFGAMLLVQAGAMLVCTANDIVFLFVGLEMVSIPTYLLLYLTRRAATTQEVATKYFFLSIFSSGLLLFGLAYLYGISGISNLKSLGFLVTHLDHVPNSSLALIALVFVMAGLGFRVAAVPFHFYAPDVYQGSPTVIAALLSWVPKAVGFVAMTRALTAVFGANDAIYHKAVILSWVMAVITMTVGNTVALRQTNLKRLLAYSSIAHAGYLMIGITSAFQKGPLFGDKLVLPPIPMGTEAVLLYLATYAMMTLGAFGVLILLGTAERPVETIDDLNGLGKTHPMVAFAMTLCLFSLAGVPPLAGFWGKLWLFSSALNAAKADQTESNLMVLLAIVGGINAAIGAYYYLRIVVAMYYMKPATPLTPSLPWPTAVAVGACASLSLLLGLYPKPLEVASHEASIASIRHPDPHGEFMPAVAPEAPFPPHAPPAGGQIGRLDPAPIPGSAAGPMPTATASVR